MKKPISGLLQSFRHAYYGLVYVWFTQRNMRVHVAAGYLVLVLASWLDLDPLRTLVVVLTVGAVLVAELFNTSVEAVVNLATREFHPEAKLAKDVAAAAVLLTSVLSVVVAVFIFGPELARLPGVFAGEWAAHPGMVGLHGIVLVVLLVTSLVMR